MKKRTCVRSRPRRMGLVKTNVRAYEDVDWLCAVRGTAKYRATVGT